MPSRDPFGRDEEIVECRDCGKAFNIAAQYYFADLCPTCVKEQEPERTWPGCFVCGEKIPPAERATKIVGPSAPGQSSERVPVHEGCK